MAYLYGNGATFDKVDEMVLVNTSEKIEDGRGDEQDFNEIRIENLFDNNGLIIIVIDYRMLKKN